MVFADAVHFLHNVHPGTLWAKKGCRPCLTANSGRRRYSVLGGYSVVDGTYVGLATDGRVNATTVIAWIEALEAAFPDASQITVYVDNARYFHARLVKAHLQGKRVRFVYLPSYSPNLNVIERLWKFCKKTIWVTFYATSAQFTQSIDAFFQELKCYRPELSTLMTENFEILERR